MKPGQIVVDRVSQRFRVSEQPYRTLKDIVVARRRASRERDLGAARRLAPGRAGRGASGSSAATAPARRPCCALVSGIFKPTSGHIETGGRIGSLLELGAGFHPDFTGRENVYLNGSIHGLSRARIREVMDEIVAFAELERAIDLPVRTYSSGMYMRLGFSVAAHIQADVLLLDEVFAVGDEDFQRKCFGKIREFKLRGGTIVFVSHDAQAVERLCDRAVLLRAGTRRLRRRDARGDRAVPPAARGRAQPRRARRGAARVGQRRGADRLGPAARLRRRRAPPVRLRRAARRRAPRRLRRERRCLRASRSSSATTTASCSAASPSRPPSSAGTHGPGNVRFASRSSISRSPRATSTSAARLIEAEGGRLLHSFDDAVRFLVFPAGTETGAVLLEGQLDDAGDYERCANRIAMSSRTCPDWPQLMEVAPELQFKHYTLREAQLPADAVVGFEGLEFDEVAHLLRSREPRLLRRSHRSRRRRGPARVALVRPARMGLSLVRPRSRLTDSGIAAGWHARR